MAVIVPIADYTRVRSEPRYAAVAPENAYAWAVQILWDQCAKAMKGLGRNHILTFAHDNGEDYEFLHRLFIDYKKKNPGQAPRLDNFVPLNDKTSPPVQAADVAASVTKRFAVDWVEDRSSVKLKRLQSTMHKIVVATEKWTKTACDYEIGQRVKRARGAMG